MANTIKHDDVARIVMLAFGKMDHGGPYWCYVAVKPSRFDEFRLAMESKKYDIQEFTHDGFGEIVVSGEGILPPQSVTKQVAKMFDMPINEMFKVAEPLMVVNAKIQQLNAGN